MTIADWMEAHPIALGFIVFWMGICISCIGTNSYTKNEEKK